MRKETRIPTLFLFHAQDLQSLSGIYFPSASFLWTDAIAFFVYRCFKAVFAFFFLDVVLPRSSQINWCLVQIFCARSFLNAGRARGAHILLDLQILRVRANHMLGPSFGFHCFGGQFQMDGSRTRHWRVVLGQTSQCACVTSKRSFRVRTRCAVVSCITRLPKRCR